MLIAIYPKTEHQNATVHQIRKYLRYVSYKDRKAVVNDLKLSYKASLARECNFSLRIF